MMKPDFKIIRQAATRDGVPPRLPLYEHFVDKEVIEAIMGFRFSEVSSREEYWKKQIEFYRQMGYDYVPVELGPKFCNTKYLYADDTALYSKGQRSWVNEHEGAIRTREDVENPDLWPSPENAFDYDEFELIASLLPEDMKIIGGASGGPFEHASFLMGLENLCIALYEDEEMVGKLFERIGTTLAAIAERLVKLDAVGIYRFGDDLGYKSATMISPEMLRKYVFPWQKKVVDIAHRAGKPFLLHSCGQLKDVMDDLIDYVGIDCKHSFEDAIMPITEAKKLWGDRVALFGGIDVDFLCRSTPQQVRERTLRIMEECSKGGGYAVGSGNTIANYVPVKNYLAMIDAAREFNGL